MSKPKHYRRGKGRYIGYGYRSVELDAKKGALSYRKSMALEIASLEGRVCPKRLTKLRKYLERVR